MTTAPGARWGWTRRLHLRLTLLALALVVLSTGIIGLFAGYSLEQSLQAETAARLVREAQHLARLIDDGALAGPTTTLDARLARLVEPLGVRLTLIERSGRVVADSEVPTTQLGRVENHGTRPEVLAAARTGIGRAIRRSTTVGRHQIYVAIRRPTALRLDGQSVPVAWVRLSLPTADVAELFRPAWGRLALVGLVTLLLVGALGAWLTRRLTAPLREIGTVARAVAGGDLGSRVRVRGEDEMGDLGRALNEVALRLGDDITRLRRLERVRSEFLGNVSHELRTPLTAIQGFLETLLDGAVDDPEVNRDFLQRALRQSGRLTALLTDLIEISRIESGELRFSPRYFDLAALARSTVEDFQPMADGRHVTLGYEGAGPVEALGDRERLRQVLTNLIENAIKYNRDGGTVTVTAKMAGDGGAEVRVQDTGCGIDETELGRVFERFYRVDKSRSREVGGTGLGLAIVKHLVEAHGGRVLVESRVEHGSTFGFQLPPHPPAPLRSPATS